MELAPIILFVYNRLDNLKKTVESLKKNELSDRSELFIYSDGAKNDKVSPMVDEVREYISKIDGFKKVTIIKRESNFGLANSIINGVSELVNYYGKVIVLEDDLITSPHFLRFMNEALTYYKDCDDIFSITGFSYPLNIKKYKYGTYLYPRPSSKSWGTWKNKWNLIEFNQINILKKWDKIFIKNKLLPYGKDLFPMFEKQLSNEIDSWAIRFTINQIVLNKYTVYPINSYVKDIGDNIGVHANDSLPHKITITHRLNCNFTDNYDEKIGQLYKIYLKKYFWNSEIHLNRIRIQKYFEMLYKPKTRDEKIKNIKKKIKKIVPESIKPIIIEYSNRSQNIISNYFDTNFEKNVLLSYIVQPFMEQSLKHTNYYEAITWAEVLNEAGYNVDIINYDRVHNDIDFRKYDLICGFGNIFQKYFEHGSNFKNIKTILYATGMHVCYQNSMTLNRVKDVYKKRGVWLCDSARFVEKTWSHQTSLVDGIISLGNDVAADSYRKYYDGKVFTLNAPFFKVKDPYAILKNRNKNSNKNFLWFGSSGLIHKGLDILLEYFSNNQELTLHICGYVSKEIDFCNEYSKELFRTPNIINYNFVDIESSKFEDILKKCDFIIYPSCSEGGAPSVLTVIGNGGLIPIITKETSISTGNEFFIPSLDYNGIDKTIGKVLKLTKNDIYELSKKNIEYVLDYHNVEIYKQTLKKQIIKIIEDS